MSTKTKRPKAEQAQALELGTGVLSWFKLERINDRYGAVKLLADGQTSENPETEKRIKLQNLPRQGTFGRLWVEIVESRQSTHIGDLFHKVSPRKTPVGKRLTLGKGKLFHAIQDGYHTVGVKPTDGRATLWLDIRALYDCHEHVVRLFFTPEEEFTDHVTVTE